VVHDRFPGIRIPNRNDPVRSPALVVAGFLVLAGLAVVVAGLGLDASVVIVLGMAVTAVGVVVAWFDYRQS
jgi:Kef-type K+ transport system membrane component KefB